MKSTRARDLDAQVRELRARIATLIEEAAANERLLKRNQERELELLKAETLPQLFETICRGLQASYRLDAVTLLLADPEHEIRHLLIAEQVRVEDFAQVTCVESIADVAPQLVSFHKPWLGPYIGADHQRVFSGIDGLKSVAFIPLRRHDRLYGSLNFGSRDEKRFSRHLATDFLAHLGVIAAFAIENTINRARLVRSGLTDFLTGWHNRRYLNARLKEELARAQRQGTNLVCFVVDLDRFKQINDEHGHLAGDAALREAALRIDSHIRGSDAAARFGGDEFVVLAPGLTSEQALVLAERIRVAVCGTPIEVASGVEVIQTVSIGVAELAVARDADLEGLAEELLSRADAALYTAKQAGRNRVVMA